MSAPVIYRARIRSLIEIPPKCRHKFHYKGHDWRTVRTVTIISLSYDRNPDYDHEIIQPNLFYGGERETH